MRRLYVLAVTLALITALVPASTHAHKGGDDDRALKRYAAATWHSFDKLVDSRTGLPADYIDGDLDPRTRAAFTSPTNIAMYLWATLAARDLGLIGSREATKRIDTTLTSVERLERHELSGQFYNWYDPTTLQKITVWPVDGNIVYPFLSSVDNGWMASGLLMVSNAVPKFRHRAGALARSMHFDCYYDPAAKGTESPGLIRGGFWRAADTPPAPLPPNPDPRPSADYCGMGVDVVYTGHHYGAFNTEPRIASDIGIAMGQIPREHYFAPWRTFPDACDWSWTETRPVGEWRTYLDVDVFEGAYRYDDQLVVPTWGGSMFEALMPALVVPEQEWGPRSWGVTHPLFVESQIEFGLDEAGYGYWGFSPSSNPEVIDGYREYGVDAIGMEPNGYSAATDRLLTLVDAGWDDPACPRLPTPISGYGEGVVTPHASFLALEIAPDAVLTNLANLKADFPGLYGRGGFKDAVNVATGKVADRYLALDQGMVIAAIANELLDGRFRDYLAVTLRPSLKRLMAMEEFGAGRVGS